MLPPGEAEALASPHLRPGPQSRHEDEYRRDTRVACKALVAGASRVSMSTQDAVILPALPRGVVASALRRHDALAKQADRAEGRRETL